MLLFKIIEISLEYKKSIDGFIQHFAVLADLK
jgi:hypothetical protein